MVKQFIKVTASDEGLVAIFQEPGIPFPRPPEKLTLAQIEEAQQSLREIAHQVLSYGAYQEQLDEYQKGIDALRAEIS